MTLVDELIAAAVVRFEFRRQLPQEPRAAYRHALIEHVKARDFSAAFELSFGKRQKDWTAAEVGQFQDYLVAMRGPRPEFGPGEVHAFPIVGTPAGAVEVSDDSLFMLADNGLHVVMDRRVAEPDWTVPIYASVLLTTGAVLSTIVSRGDRVAILKHLAQTQAVFGYWIVFDVYFHKITDRQAAVRGEAIGMHVGTRDRRLARMAEYERTPAGVVFPKPPMDIDMRNQTEVPYDPYAEIFVSTPPHTGQPS
jgi:hypothetical protein